MAFLQDHLVSLIIGGLVLFVLTQIYFESVDAGVDVTNQYASYSNSLEFIEFIQRDFPNIGAGMAAADTMMLGYQWNAAGKFLEFTGAVGGSPSSPTQRIRYQVVSADSLNTYIADSLHKVPVFEVQRLVRDSLGVLQFSGASAPSIQQFDIHLYNAAGIQLDTSGVLTPIQLDSTRVIEVTMQSMPNLATSKSSHNSMWQTRYRPQSLALKN